MLNRGDVEDPRNAVAYERHRARRGLSARIRDERGDVRSDDRFVVEQRGCSLGLDARSFSYWSEAANAWRVAPGCDGIRVGSSSRQLALSGRIAQAGGSC